MIPILYEVNETAFSTQGIGALGDAVSVKIARVLNGKDELTMVYPNEGIRYADLQNDRIIYAQPEYRKSPQPYQIYKITKPMNGLVIVYARHVGTQRASFLPVLPFSNGSVIGVLNDLPNYILETNPFTFWTNKNTVANFALTKPASLGNVLGGKAGSILDVYGGEYEFDGYTIKLWNKRGSDHGVELRYAKNITDIEQSEDFASVVTGVVPYWEGMDGETVTLPEHAVYGSLAESYPFARTIVKDFSEAFEEAPTEEQLRAKATSWVEGAQLPDVSLKVNFEHLAQYTEYEGMALLETVNLGDTVSIYYEPLDLSKSARIVSTNYDCLNEKYISVQIGSVSGNLEQVMSRINSTTETLKDNVTKSLPSALETAIENATELITGVNGGYVVLNTDANGKPYEILIMDNADKASAINVIRLNQNGIGFSRSGYSGPFYTAWTIDSSFVADYITTGNLNASLLTAGIITDETGNNYWNLDTGEVSFGNYASGIISSIEVRYARSTTSAVPANFPSTAPYVPTDAYPYVWSRTIATYRDGSQSSPSYSCSTKGTDGTGIEILGSYETMADLQTAHPTGSAGQAYMVGTDLVVWDAGTSAWKNVGRIQGANGESALWLNIDTDDDGENNTVTYSGHLVLGTNEDVTSSYDAVFVWDLVTEDGVTRIGTDTPSVSVNRSDAGYGATVRCSCTAVASTEPLEDYSYTTITDYSGNSITIVSSSNITLFAEAALYKSQAIASAFTVTNNAIAAEVSARTEEGASLRSSIQLNADNIALKVSESDVTGNYVISKINLDSTTATIEAEHINLVGAVTASALTSGAVTADKIASGAVTAAKISANAVTAEKIAANAITSEKISATSITSAKLAAGAVTADKISSVAVTAEKIAASAITADKISSGAITADKISSGAVTATKISSGAVTADKIAASAVSAGKIASGAVTTDKLAAGAVTAEKISVTDLYAIGATIGGFTIDQNTIRKGTLGAANSIWLSSNGTSTYANIGNSGSINGWAITAGSAFGVTKAGKLYCSGAVVSGTVNATGGTFSGTINGGSFVGGTYMSKSGSGNASLSGGSLAFGPDGNINGYGYVQATASGMTVQGNAKLTLTSASGAVYSSTIYGTVQTGGSYIRIGSDGKIGISTSSERYKHDIKQAEDKYFDGLLQVKPSTFVYNDLPKTDEHYEKQICGLIAEDVQEHFPVATIYRDNEVDNWDDRMVLTGCLALIQKLYKRIDELEELWKSRSH